MLDVHDLCVRFGERTVLDHVSLHIDTGDVVALVGPSGSGKTILLRVIAGLRQPDTGSVWLDDREITNEPSHRRGVGLVFQDNQLFPHRTVGQNIAFGLRVAGRNKHAQRVRVDELLALVGLRGFADRSVGSLSGGEAKRVALARSLAPHPAVLLLDEPSTGVDPVSRRVFWEIIHALSRQGITILVTTHYMDEAESCDVVSFILDGRIIDHDTPQNLIAGEAGARNLEDFFIHRVEQVTGRAVSGTFREMRFIHEK